MALFRVSKATEKDTKVRVKLLSETLMGLYWMLSGLWSCYLKPTGGDGCACGTGWKWKCYSMGAIKCLHIWIVERAEIIS